MVYKKGKLNINVDAFSRNQINIHENEPMTNNPGDVDKKNLTISEGIYRKP